MNSRCVVVHAVLAFLVVSTNITALPPDTLWTKIYSSSGADVAYSVTETSDGYYLVAGYTGFGAGGQDCWLLKLDNLDNNGDTLWAKTFGGSGYDGAHRVIEAHDGGYLVVGFTESFGAGGKDLYIIKTDTNGTPQWTKTYGYELQDVGYAACKSTDGYYICGYRDGPIGWTKGDLWILEIDESGDTLWTKQYGKAGEDYCISIRKASPGFILSGTTVFSGGGGKNAWLVRIDDEGDTIWTKTYGGSQEDVAYGVNITSDGGYILTGYVDGTGAWTAGDMWFIKTDDEGDTLWTKRYGSAGEDFGFDVYETADGGYITGGMRATNSGNLWIVKTDASGDTLWTGVYGGAGQQSALSLCPTSDGGYLAAGMSMPGSTPDLYLVKTIPVLELVAPNGGENLSAGSSYTIRWLVENYPEPPHFYIISYSTDGGESYQTIASEISPQDTALEWTVVGELSATCRIKIELLDGFYDVIAEDESDANFIIGPGIDESPLSELRPNFDVAGNQISYYLPMSGYVSLVVYDVCGRSLARLVDGHSDAGYHSLRWRSETNGVYFVRFTAPGIRQTTKIIEVE